MNTDKPREKGSRLDPEESQALLRASNLLGLEAVARECDVAPTTLARAIARAPLYGPQKRRMRGFLEREKERAA
jgi:hypothetical protein